MSVQLRRSVSAFASLSLLGLALSTATGCATVAGLATSNVPSALGDPASLGNAATEAVAGTEVSPRDVTGQTVAGTKLEIVGIQALVDQEKKSLTARGLSAHDRAQHQSTLAKLIKMKSDSEADLVALEHPARANAGLVAVASRGLHAPSFAGAALTGVAKLSGARIPVPGQLGRLPGGLGGALGSVSAIAGAAHDPKGAAMALAKLGASRVPGGASILGAAGSVANLAQDPKGAAKDLAKQGVMTAANKLPIPGGLRSSLFGGFGLTK
jgi:hypothetical protein